MLLVERSFVGKNGFFLFQFNRPGKMRNIDNAISDVLTHYNGNITARIVADPNVPDRWRIEVRHVGAPDALLEIEVLNLENEPVACVLQKVNVGRRSMNKFMDLLVDYLEDVN